MELPNEKNTRAQVEYPLDPESVGALMDFLEKNFAAFPFRSRKDSLTIAVGATSFDVSSNFMVLTGAGGVTIATIKGGYEGQTITLLFTDANITVTDTGTGAADTVNLSAAFTSTANDILELKYNGTSWFEVGRSVN